MTRLFRWTVDIDALTDEAYAFVTDPHPSRNERAVIQELHEINPESVDVLESMLINGTEERERRRRIHRRGLRPLCRRVGNGEKAGFG